MSTTWRRILLGISVAAAVAVSVGSCVNANTQGGSRGKTPAGVPQDLAKVWETYQALQQRYVDKSALDPEKLSAGAIKGMLQALDDPFTSYFDADQFRTQADGPASAFQGVGATVALKDGKPTVVEALPDSPAEKAGLRAGDIIQRVDGQATDGLSLQEVIEKVRGPEGTTVRLTIQRSGGGEPTEFSITRATIQFATVTSQIIEPGIGVVRVSEFARRTTREMDRALESLQQQNVKAILLDLRGNPGGLLTVVVDVASQFLKDGLVLYEVDAAGKRTDWKVQGGGRFADAPIAVLVNGASASGAEVVAGAIQSRGRGKLIGTRTFGKGVVDIPVTLKDGSGLLITTATWYTPSGTQIGKVGLTPDIEVRRTFADVEAGRDPQIERALQLVRDALGARG